MGKDIKEKIDLIKTDINKMLKENTLTEYIWDLIKEIQKKNGNIISDNNKLKSFIDGLWENDSYYYEPGDKEEDSYAYGESIGTIAPPTEHPYQINEKTGLPIPYSNFIYTNEDAKIEQEIVEKFVIKDNPFNEDMTYLLDVLQNNSQFEASSIRMGYYLERKKLKSFCEIDIHINKNEEYGIDSTIFFDLTKDQQNILDTILNNIKDKEYQNYLAENDEELIEDYNKFAHECFVEAMEEATDIERE